MTMDYDHWLAAICLFRENRGGTMPQMNAIWWVIMNRMTDTQGRWPKDIAGVILEPYQFSSFNLKNNPDAVFPNRKDMLDWDAWQRCQMVVTNPLGNDPTNGANAYEAIPACQPKPDWCDPTKITLELGPFTFYKL